MDRATVVLNQVNIVSGSLGASIAFYRRLGMEIPDERIWRTPTGIHHAGATNGGNHAIDLDLDSVAFARLWNSGWSGRSDVKGRVVIGFRVPSRDAVDRIYVDLMDADIQDCTHLAMRSGALATRPRWDRRGPHESNLAEFSIATA
ncbi:MAG: hypothetical protein ACRD30_07895 [Bryobacteraceae bacterium]